MNDTDTLKQFFTYESIVLMYRVVNLIQYIVSKEEQVTIAEDF